MGSIDRLRRIFSLGGKGEKSQRESKKGQGGRADKRGGFAKSNTAGTTSEETVLVNETKGTLVFRDKVGAAYGGTRYKIPGNSEMKVTTLQHTFFKMLAYAIEEEDEEEVGSTSSQPSAPPDTDQELSTEVPEGPKTQKKKKKKHGVDTMLTITSDHLADHRKITISLDESKYVLKMDPRN